MLSFWYHNWGSLVYAGVVMAAGNELDKEDKLPCILVIECGARAVNE